MHYLPSPDWADFPIMMEFTPEKCPWPLCVYSVGTLTTPSCFNSQQENSRIHCRLGNFDVDINLIPMPI